MRKNHHRLVLLSGPSGAGKSPLVKALARRYPERFTRFAPIVGYTSRSARPGEREGEDYHFRSREEILRLKDYDDFVVERVRGDVQAVDVGAVVRCLEQTDVLYEGNVFIAERLLDHPRLAGAEVVSIFLAPLSRVELRQIEAAGAGVETVIVELMRRKLLRRLRAQKQEVGLPDLEDVEERAQSAPRELARAGRFQHVVVCHDGEDSEDWDAFPIPLGEARLAVEDVAAIIEGRTTARVERWGAERRRAG